MKFTVEEVEKLTVDIMKGAKEEIPEGIELTDEESFIRFFTAMAVYIIGISKAMESINKRLETIELTILEKGGIGSA